MTLIVPDAHAASTGSIIGTATDGQGAPFAGALVSAYHSDGYGGWPLVGQAVTAGDGTYEISDLPAGRYRVGFSADGYMTKYYRERLNPDLSWPPIDVIAGSTTSGIDVVMAPAGATTRITGTVTDTDGHGVDHIAVLAYRQGVLGWDYDQSTYTTGDGTYTLDNLAGGLLYILQFTGDYGTPYAEKYWMDAIGPDSATQLFVPIGVTTSGIDVTMDLAGHISGRVTDEADGSGIANVTVYAYRLNGKGEWPWWANVSTAADGTYDIGGLPRGTYRVEFSYWAANAYQWWDGAPTLNSATDVVVVPGATTSGIDATFASGPLGGNVAGTVTDTGGAGLAGIQVALYRYDDALDDWDYAAEATTASDGAYLICGLTTDTYRLEFWDESGTYVSQFYDGASTFFMADDLDVRAGTTTRADATLAVGGHISGRISTGSSADLSDVCVVAYQSDGSGGWEYVNDVFASSDGTYDLGDLAPGEYRVGFEDYSGTYLAQYYLGSRDLDSATDVSVAEGETTSGIDVTLGEAGHIVGLVTSAGLHGIGDISVMAYRSVEGSWEPVAGTFTTAGGIYDLGGLDSGTYRIEFTDYSGRYAPVWYADRQNVATATDVAVVAGGTTPGINATLLDAGHITGVVTDAGHVGLADIDVSAFQSDGAGGWTYVGGVMTGDDGRYDLAGLGSGAYRLEFADYEDGDYFGQYYDNKGSLDAADDVAVTAGTTTAGIDVVLVSAYIVDTTPPTTTLAGADGLWHNAPVTLSLSASDAPGGSGMAGGEAITIYRIGGGSWKMGATIVVPAPPDHSGDGRQTVSYRSCDAAGNWEVPKSATVMIDTTAPAGGFTLGAGADRTTTAEVLAGSSVSDANGVAAMRFSADGKASWTDWEAYAASRSVKLQGELGSKTVYAQYRDPAGNVLELSDAIELTAPPDVTPPSVVSSGVIEGGLYRGAVQVTLTASDAGSGVATVTCALDGIWTTAAGASKVVTVPALPNGKHRLTFHATDGAANSCADQTLSFTIDSTGPVASAKAASGTASRAISLRYMATDNLSPRIWAPKVVVKNARGRTVWTSKTSAATSRASGTWYSVRWKPKARGTYRYYVYGRDLAGNAQRRVGSAKVVVR